MPPQTDPERAYKDKRAELERAGMIPPSTDELMDRVEGFLFRDKAWVSTGTRDLSMVEEALYIRAICAVFRTGRFPSLCGGSKVEMRLSAGSFAFYIRERYTALLAQLEKWEAENRPTAPPPNPKAKPHVDLAEFFARRFQETRGQAYPLQKQDFIIAAKILKQADQMGVGVEGAMERAEALLGTSNQWEAEHASLELLSKRFRNLGIQAVKPSAGEETQSAMEAWLAGRSA